MTKTKKKLTTGDYRRAILDNTKDAELIVKINNFRYTIEEYQAILGQVVKAKTLELKKICEELLHTHDD